MAERRSKSEYRPTSVSPPGETLRELLEERGISQAELAERSGRPRKTINEILSGKTAITPETALQLELVLGVPASFWNARETRYREFLARDAELKRLARLDEWVKKFPVREMVRRGWMPAAKSASARAQSVLEFFGVASSDQWEAVHRRHAVAFRKSASFAADELALAAWLRRGTYLAERTSTVAFNEESFRRCLEEARGMTREVPRVFRQMLQECGAASGVVIAFVPELRGCRAHGATRWLSPKRALIQLSFRYKSDDQFWFTFFHEAAHILLHRKKAIFIEGGEEGGGREEEEANRFAAEFLVPSEKISGLDPNSISKPLVLELSDDLGVSPGIVVGRLQHEGIVPHSRYNDLKAPIDWDWDESSAEQTPR